MAPDFFAATPWILLRPRTGVVDPHCDSFFLAFGGPEVRHDSGGSLRQKRSKRKSKKKLEALPHLFPFYLSMPIPGGRPTYTPFQKKPKKAKAKKKLKKLKTSQCAFVPIFSSSLSFFPSCDWTFISLLLLLISTECMGGRQVGRATAEPLSDGTGRVG